MRILATLSLLAVGTLANQFLAEQALPVVKFDSGLSCGACVLGGYVFAYRGSQDWKCCKADDTACWSGYTKRSNSGDYKDEFQMLYTFCDNSAVRPAICGPNKVYHIEKGENDTVDVTGMNFTDSCTFKVFSNCSSPVFTVNATDVNVLVSSFKGGKSDNDDAKNGTFQMGSKKNGKTIATVSDAVKGSDCTQRRMYVTLTRVEPANQTQQFTSRMLAATPTLASYKLTISSAAFFKASLLIAASAILSVFAF